MLNVFKLFALALTALMLSCADYKELDLSIKPGETITDARDGNVYETVIIGEQEWMAKNLNYEGPSKDSIGLCYKEDAKNCSALGRLYTWAESMAFEPKYDSVSYGSNIIAAKHRGICPPNWHLPSEDDWMELYDYIGADNNGAVKLKTINGWGEPKGTNEYGFSAVAAGYHFNGPQDLGICGAWWSSKEEDNARVFGFEICKGKNKVLLLENLAKQPWASIRCVKN